MPQIDQRECDMMKPEAISCFAFKTDQQRLEFVNPCECALTNEAPLVHFGVKVSFPSTFHAFSIPLVFRNVGNDTAIPQQLPRCTRVKAAISIKAGTGIVQSASLHIFEDILQFLFKLKAVVLVSSKYAGRRDNRTVFVRHG